MAKARIEKTLGINAARFARLDLDPALRSRRTTSDYIADALRAAIYDGQFADGEEFNQVELAEYFKVSRVPIREALRRLQAEGLVSDTAHKRAFVIGLSLPEILEMIEIRALLEGFLVEKAGPELEISDLHRLEQVCDEQDLIQEYDYNWVLKNWEFHRTLYMPSGLHAATGMVEQLHLKVERYVRRAGRIQRLRQATSEHRDIVSALQLGDHAKARMLMQTHILHTGDEVRLYLSSEPDKKRSVTV